MTEKEAEVWQVLLAHRKLSPGWVAEQCGVDEEFVQRMIDRIGSPNWRDEPSGTKVEMKPHSTRETLLTEAKSLTGVDRDRTYGAPYDNLSNCAHLWGAYLNAKPGCMVRNGDTSYAIRITAEDVAWLLSLVKTARSFNPGYHADNYADAAAYAAIAGECRETQEAEDG
jgi:hypothetical protein